MDFYIDGDDILCPDCVSAVSLLEKGSSIDYCTCKNTRLVRCRSMIHIILIKEKKELWYAYK